MWAMMQKLRMWGFAIGMGRGERTGGVGVAALSGGGTPVLRPAGLRPECGDVVMWRCGDVRQVDRDGSARSAGERLPATAGRHEHETPRSCSFYIATSPHHHIATYRRSRASAGGTTGVARHIATHRRSRASAGRGAGVRFLPSPHEQRQTHRSRPRSGPRRLQGLRAGAGGPGERGHAGEGRQVAGDGRGLRGPGGRLRDPRGALPGGPGGGRGRLGGVAGRETPGPAGPRGGPRRDGAGRGAGGDRPGRLRPVDRGERRPEEGPVLDAGPDRRDQGLPPRGAVRGGAGPDRGRRGGRGRAGVPEPVGRRRRRRGRRGRRRARGGQRLRGLPAPGGGQRPRPAPRREDLGVGAERAFGPAGVRERGERAHEAGRGGGGGGEARRLGGAGPDGLAVQVRGGGDGAGGGLPPAPDAAGLRRADDPGTTRRAWRCWRKPVGRSPTSRAGRWTSRGAGASTAMREPIATNGPCPREGGVGGRGRAGHRRLNPWTVGFSAGCGRRSADPPCGLAGGEQGG